MGAEGFDRALAFVWGQEGGYANAPADHGGATKYGISQRAYPDLDIASLTREAAAEIYRRDYWEPLRCDELPAPVALAVFDTAVNSGCFAAAILLQRSYDELAKGLDWLRPDGQLGPRTLEAVLRWCDGAAPGSVNAWRLAWRVCHLRVLYDLGLVVKMPDQIKFLDGWTQRVHALEVSALEASGLHA